MAKPTTVKKHTSSRRVATPATRRNSAPKSHDFKSLAKAYSCAPLPTIIATDRAVIKYVNSAFSELFGYSEREAQKGIVSFLVHPAEAETFSADWKILVDGDISVLNGRFRFITRHSTILRTHTAIAPSLVAGKKGKRYFIIQLLDVTESYQEIEQVVESAKQLHAILDNSSASIFVKDLDGRYMLVNRRFEILHRLIRANVLGRSDNELFSKKNARLFRKHDADIIAYGTEYQTEEEILIGNELHTLITMKFPLRNLEGDIVAVCGMSTDITRRKRAENRLKILNEKLIKANDELKVMQLQLIQAEKLESIGRLAAGVAHEVKNPLALLLMGVEYLEANVPTNDENVPVILTEMREAITRAERIIVGMVDFSASHQLDLKPCSLNHIINGVEILLRHQVTRKSVRFITKLDDALPEILADVTKIEQVVLNLCINSIHALKKGGRIVITTSSRVLGDKDRNNFGSRTANPFRAGDLVVIVEIKDNGPGIPPDILPKIFDPFFTTKATGEGTGLGLSVTRRIVELHEGNILIENDPKGGVKATLTFKARQSMLPTNIKAAAARSH